MTYYIISIINKVLHVLKTGESLMDATIICGLISGLTTLIVSIGTWRITLKKDHNQTKSELQEAIKADHAESMKGIQELKEDLTEMGANLQQKIAVVEVQIGTLSNRVEKHNQVIERTYKLEQAVEDLKQTIA